MTDWVKESWLPARLAVDLVGLGRGVPETVCSGYRYGQRTIAHRILRASERLDIQLEVEMSEKREGLFTAPVFLGMAFFVFGIAIVEKFLNLIGLSIPFTTVYPAQLLQWAATLLVFDIALVLRQMLENKL